MNIFARQLTSLTLANMKARYRKTFAGFVWVILNPIILYSVQSVVFKNILKIEIPDYTIFLLGGLLPWIFITSTLDMSTPYLFNSSNLLRGFRINPLLLILSQVLDNFINFFFAFTIIFIPRLFMDNQSESALYLLILPIMILFLSVTALSSFCALANIFYRDTKFVISFILSIMYFVTPIFYPIDFVPQKYRLIVYANPLYHLIEATRSCLYHYNPNVFWPALLRATGVCLIICVASALYWKKRKNDLYYYI